MKKLKLKALELGASDVLTREQLKNVMGSGGSGGGVDPCDDECEKNSDCIPLGYTTCTTYTTPKCDNPNTVNLCHN